MGAAPNLEYTGVDSEVWTFDTGEPVTVKQILGLAGAPFKYDDVKGVGQAGVTNVGLDRDPNVTTLLANLKAPAGSTESERLGLLDAWLTSIGNGAALTSGGALGKLECLDSGRYQRVRLANPDLLATVPYFQFVNTGFWRFELALRSDESWWRTDPYVSPSGGFTAAQFATATVDNLGNEGVWPVIKITGPVTTPTIGWAGDTVVLPTVTAGHWLEIDSDPDWWTAVTDLGVDASWIGDRWYTKLPPGTAVPLTISGSGTSGATRVLVTVPQLFHRAL